MSNKVSKSEKTQYVMAAGIIGYILGILVPSALIGSAISFVGGLILLCSFLYYCKIKADELEERGE